MAQLNFSTWFTLEMCSHMAASGGKILKRQNSIDFEPETAASHVSKANILSGAFFLLATSYVIDSNHMLATQLFQVQSCMWEDTLLHIVHEGMTNHAPND